MTVGASEIILTDRDLTELVGAPDMLLAPPHVEVAARVHARDIAAVNRGEFVLTVSPARAGGTLTSRFTTLAGGAGLERLYRDLPAGIDGAASAQLSFPPLYAHAENVTRIPALLPDQLSLGEYRTATGHGGQLDAPLRTDDLAVLATTERLVLVSISRGQVVEPWMVHALAMDKQAPPLARFLAELPRAFCAQWTEFDWGPAARELPFLPRVRYGRTILSRARWALRARDLADTLHDVDSPRSAVSTDKGIGRGAEITFDRLDADQFADALGRWRRRWRCPSAVEMRDDDRTLPLDLDHPGHRAVLRAHLRRRRELVVLERLDAELTGWLDGHIGEIAVPLITTAAPRPNPLTGSRPPGPAPLQAPHGPDSRWLSAKVFSPAARHDDVLAGHLPGLLDELGPDGATSWFVRYRAPQETDHLRVRVPASAVDGRPGDVIGRWFSTVHRRGLATRLTFDTFVPEVGRYGSDEALIAAEAVFAADTQVVLTQLTQLSPGAAVEPSVRVVVNMIDIAIALLGDDVARAVRWLLERPARTPPVAERALSDRTRAAVDEFLTAGSHLFTRASDLDRAWRARRAALAHYREALGGDQIAPDRLATVLESLLHLHHNRAVGIDPDRELVCRHLTRQAAIAWTARRSQPSTTSTTTATPGASAVPHWADR